MYKLKVKYMHLLDNYLILCDYMIFRCFQHWRHKINILTIFCIIKNFYVVIFIVDLLYLYKNYQLFILCFLLFMYQQFNLYISTYLCFVVSFKIVLITQILFIIIFVVITIRYIVKKNIYLVYFLFMLLWNFIIMWW